jgi:hypothetical protein
MLKLAEAIYSSGDSEEFNRLCIQFDAYLKKCAHYEPVNDGTTPNPWRHNMDYAGWESSPYYGSMTEFMEKFPGGIPDWIKWRRETQKERNLIWSKVSARRDVVRNKIADKNTQGDEFLVWKFTAHHTMLIKHEMKKRIKEYLVALLKQPEITNKAQIQNISELLKKQKYQMIDDYVDIAIKTYNLEAMIRTLVRFRGTLQYEKYVKLFEEMKTKIMSSAFERFDDEVWKIKTAAIEVEKPFQPTREELEESKAPPTEEEREKARQLIEKVLEILTKEEAEMLLEESAPKNVIEAHYVPVGPDDTEKFPKEPHLWSDEGLKKFKSVTEYLKKYRGQSQDANDMGTAALRAIQDFIDYWKLLQKGRKRRKKKKRAHGKK